MIKQKTSTDTKNKKDLNINIEKKDQQFSKNKKDLNNIKDNEYVPSQMK